MARPIYFDCDTGIDDALALCYLMASPEIELAGIGTVCGNIGADQGARNTLDLLALGGRSDVPVAVGARNPLTGQFSGGVPHIHGANGVGNVTLPRGEREPEEESAADMLIRLSHQYPGELEVVAVGPLTNLALALSLDPTITERVRTVTIMGGAALVSSLARVPGTVSPGPGIRAALTTMSALAELTTMTRPCECMPHSFVSKMLRRSPDRQERFGNQDPAWKSALGRGVAPVTTPGPQMQTWASSRIRSRPCLRS